MCVCVPRHVAVCVCVCVRAGEKGGVWGRGLGQLSLGGLEASPDQARAGLPGPFRGAVGAFPSRGAGGGSPSVLCSLPRAAMTKDLAVA